MIVSEGQTLTISRQSAAALGDSTPLLVGGSFYAQSVLELSGLWQAYGEMYRTQPWVYTLARKVAVSGARLPILVHQRSDDGSRPPVIGSAYGQLLANPSTILDPFSFWLRVMEDFEVYGESIVWKMRDERGVVNELFPMHPTNIVVRRTSAGSFEYVYMPGTRSGSPLPVMPATDIIHFKSYNPNSVARGMSWLEPLRQTLLTDDASRRAQSSMWSNGARPSVVVTTPNKLSDPALTRVAASWKAMHAGVDNWAKTIILEEGMTVQPFQMSAVDMQYIAARQLAREECCAVADVAPPIVHILDHATFSNITEQFRSMYRDTMAPRLALYESVLDHQLRPDFDVSGTLRAAFDMNEVLAGSPEMQALADKEMVASGVITPNEARAHLRLVPHPDGNRLMVNAAFIPLGTATEGPPAGTDIEVHPQAVKTADVRALLRRLGRMSNYVEKSAALEGTPADIVAALDHVGPIVSVADLRAAVIALEQEPA